MVRNLQELTEKERKALSLLEDIAAQGLTITAEGERLRVKPSGQLAPRQRDAMIALKPEVLTLVVMSNETVQPSHSVAVEIEPVVPKLAPRDRWTTDPRPDLTTDTAAWSLLLGIAYDADGDIPAGVFGVLHGLRCVGVGLERDERGRWLLVAGAVEPAEYDEIRDVWLMPKRKEIAELLRRLEEA